MRLVATNRLEPGMLLGRDVLTDVHGRVPLLRAGVPLDARYRQALLDAGIHAVYVEDELGAGIEVTQALSQSTREHATKALVRSFNGAPALLADGRTLPDTAISELADVAARISSDLADADDAELAIMRTHPLVGLELLPGDVIGPLAKSVVRSHHEHFDGSGYPNGMAGTDISEFARIAAVADVFDAITSERPYARAAPPHVGVRAIVEGSGRGFDPLIVDSFRQVVAPFPPGCEIVLPTAGAAWSSLCRRTASSCRSCAWASIPLTSGSSPTR